MGFHGRYRICYPEVGGRLKGCWGSKWKEVSRGRGLTVAVAVAVAVADVVFVSLIIRSGGEMPKYEEKPCESSQIYRNLELGITAHTRAEASFHSLEGAGERPEMLDKPMLQPSFTGLRVSPTGLFYMEQNKTRGFVCKRGTDVNNNRTVFPMTWTDLEYWQDICEHSFFLFSSFFSSSFFATNVQCTKSENELEGKGSYLEIQQIQQMNKQ